MAKQHRMVGTGTQMLEYAYPSSGRGLCEPDGADEILSPKMGRATEGHQTTVRRQRLQGERVELQIQPLGTLGVFATARERRRVQHARSGRDFAEQGAVLTLVQEVAGLLAAFDVDSYSDPVLDNYQFGQGLARHNGNAIVEA